MEPIAWPNAAFARMFPEQNLLADQRYHDGVVHVVVGSITIGNILQREATNKTNDVRIGGLKDSVDLAVLASKLLDERLDDKFCWVEHDRLPLRGSAKPGWCGPGRSTSWRGSRCGQSCHVSMGRLRHVSLLESGIG